MRKWRSKPKKVDRKVVKHYFGFKIPKLVTHKVTVRLPYELKTLNGQKIVVVYKPEGVTHAKEKYPKNQSLLNSRN